ncbi:hypothetical protein OAG73_00385 [bacterium]|nr:hypothetical protein [bacterium]
MNLRRFTSSNARRAIKDVYDALGPDAVIVNIRPVSKPGLQGLFKSQQVEVSVLLPEQSRMGSSKMQSLKPVENVPQPTLPEVTVTKKSENHYGTRLNMVDDAVIELPKPSATVDNIEVPGPNLKKSTEPDRFASGEHWGAEQVLESVGILPLYVEKLINLAKRRYPQFENVSLKEQLKHIRFCVLDRWTGLASESKKNGHPRKLLVGPPRLRQDHGSLQMDDSNRLSQSRVDPSLAFGWPLGQHS